MKFSDLPFWEQPTQCWLFRQAYERLGPPPEKGLATIYGWSQWRGERRKRPDMRYFRHGPPWEAPVTRLELDIPDSLVALFDFDLLTNYVPFNLYLAVDSRDQRRFEREAEKVGLDPLTARNNQALAGEIQSSWARIFDLSFMTRPDGQHQKEGRSIGALCWEYREEWVKRVDHFDFTKKDHPEG